MINGNKIKLKYYVQKQVERLCNQKNENTISFIKESTVRKSTYNSENNIYTPPNRLNSAFDNVRKLNPINNASYAPYSYAYSKKANSFITIGHSAQIYDIKHGNIIKKLPKEFKYSSHIALSPNGKYLAVQRDRTKIFIWDMINSKIIKTIDTKLKYPSNLKIFLSDNKTLLLSGKKIYLLDIHTTKIVGEIEPKFTTSNNSFNNTRISAIIESPDSKRLYIAGNNTIEQWDIKKRKYIDSLTTKDIKIGALLFNPKYKNILIVASKNKKVIFLDIQNSRVLKTYIADEYIGSKSIGLSSNYKYMLIFGERSIFLWNLKNSEQLDIIKGDRITGGIFIPNSLQYLNQYTWVIDPFYKKKLRKLGIHL